MTRTDDGMRAAARVADREDGVVSRARLLALGVDDDRIQQLVARGRLQRAGRNVLRFPGAGSGPRSRLRAALIEIPAAAAARRWALWLHGVLSAAPSGPACVVVPYGCSARVGVHVCVHRSRSFDPDDHTVVGGLRSTRIERALVESWAELPARERSRALQRAIVDGATDASSILAELALLGNIRGAAAVRRELGELPASVGRLRSTGELAFLEAFAAAGLPTPVVNHAVTTAAGARRELDAAYPELHLAYELDGRAWHAGPLAGERDRVRDLELAALGWTLHRVPARLLTTPTQLQRLLRGTYDRHVASTS